MKAVYAGSFDPPTLGHAWIIEQAARMFPEIVVAVGVDPEKTYTYDLSRRKLWLHAMIADFPHVEVGNFENLFLVNYAKQIGAEVIIRGIRNPQDFVAEQSMRRINGDLHPGILTVFLMPPRELAEISSSVVKGMIGPDGWQDVVRKYLPYCVSDYVIFKCG